MKILSTQLTTDRRPYDVFISYNSKDVEAVGKVAQHLVSVGLKPWFDKWVLVPGEPWLPATERGIADSSCCAVFYGISGEGPWQRREIEVVLREQVKSSNFRVIPVLLPGAQKPDISPTFLSGNTWVRLHETEADIDGLWRLECGVLGVSPLTGQRRTASEADRLVRQQLGIIAVETSDLSYLPRPQWAMPWMVTGEGCYIAAVPPDRERAALQLIVSRVDPDFWPRMCRLEATVSSAREAQFMEILSHSAYILESSTQGSGIRLVSVTFLLTDDDVETAMALLRSRLLSLKPETLAINRLRPVAPVLLWKYCATVEKKGINSAAWRHLAEQALSLGAHTAKMLSSVLIEADTEAMCTTYTWFDPEVYSLRISMSDQPGSLRAVMLALTSCGFEVISSFLRPGGLLRTAVLHVLVSLRTPADEAKFKRSVIAMIAQIPPVYEVRISIS